MRTDEFFATARERYAIRERRLLGHPWPWTDDPIFKQWHFCNVHREHDKTTIWFRENLRSRVEGTKALRVTFLFRWFNRIEVVELIKDLILYTWQRTEARKRLKDVHPIVSAAYMVRTRAGLNKLDGVINATSKGLPMLRHIKVDSIEKMVEALRKLPYVGPFLGYEIASDLRHTNVLNNAPDIMTWANPGPGCARGLTWLAGRDGLDPAVRFKPLAPLDRMEMISMMQYLLKRAPENWPAAYQPLEMREIEGWACEYDRYKRAQLGQRLTRSYKTNDDPQK